MVYMAASKLCQRHGCVPKRELVQIQSRVIENMATSGGSLQPVPLKASFLLMGSMDNTSTSTDYWVSLLPVMLQIAILKMMVWALRILK